MSKFKTAAQLGILPAERKAFIAFLKAPAEGRKVAVNGKTHYYDQSFVSDRDTAKAHGCGTAGCVAGFVHAHARHVQGLSSLRGARTADNYMAAACADEYPKDDWWPVPKYPLLDALYSEGEDRTLTETRSVVRKMLRTGRVKWRQKVDR
jgi:hypothetical protein